jgi:hypothetical protein
MSPYPDDDDGAALADLAAHGVDMTTPLVFEFAIDVPDEATATAVHAALIQHGYQADIEYDSGEADEYGDIDPEDEELGPSWTVYAKNVTLLPTYQELTRVQAELERIASPLGGHSDGWGTLLDTDIP